MKIKKILLFFIIYLIGFVSPVFLFKTFPQLKNYGRGLKVSEEYKDFKKSAEKHKYWAKKLSEGGYFLHIRHGMREKWETVTGFDTLELINGADAREEDYYRAVCLTEKGVIESKLVGEIFEKANIDLSFIVSSPSCRARETAIFAFNKIDQVEPSILHRTAQHPSQHIDLGKKFRAVIDDIPIVEGKNVLISGHGGTLSYDLKNNVGIVDVNEVSSIDSRKETGIIIIERKNGKYIARHKFDAIHELANTLDLPIDNPDPKQFIFDKDSKYKPDNIKKGFQGMLPH